MLEVPNETSLLLVANEPEPGKKTEIKEGLAIQIVNVGKNHVNHLYESFFGEAPLPIQSLGLLGCVLTVVIGICHLIADIWVPSYLILDFYMVVACIVAMILECSRSLSFCISFDRTVKYWARCLGRCWGKGFLYVFIAGVNMIKWTTLTILCGIYMLMMGLTYLYISVKASRQLYKLRVEAHRKYGEANWENCFEKYDNDQTDSISSKNFENFIQELNSNLSPNDIKCILNFFDVDRQNFIKKEEFEKHWWKDNHYLNHIDYIAL